MKYKKIKQKSDGARLLKVILDKKKDAFNYVVAMRLSANEIDGLLPFSFSKESVLPDLFYNITDLTTLKVYLDTRQSLSQFKSLLMQLSVLLETLNAGGLPVKNLVLDMDSIYVDVSDNAVQFIYLPLDSQPVKDNAVLDLLLRMVQTVKFVVESDKSFADDLADFIKRQSVFSLIDLKRFLGHDASDERNDSSFGGQSSFSYNAPSGDSVELSSTKLGVTNNSPAQAGTTLNGASANAPSPVRRSTGRDFVTELSGVQTKEQQYVSRSVAENILTAISEDLNPVAVSGSLDHAPDIKTTSATKTPIVPNEVDSKKQDSMVLTASSEQIITSLHSNKESFKLVRLSDFATWNIVGEGITLGRSKTARLQISDSTSVSRIHATISLENHSVCLSDNNSSNGTFVNGMRLASGQKVAIKLGDLLVFGDQEFRIEQG